ncbi:MAG TPA: Fur family transcriptional regulator [Thermoanaerobaculia bacterium]|nr:Fur family transcriptional regulator [Thermoanaerobaculia bacterium]
MPAETAPAIPTAAPSPPRSMASPGEKEQLLAYLRQRGQRVTGERLALFEEIYRHHGHIDAEELLGAMKAAGHKISRATVYRNLDLLVDCGLVKKQRLGRDRYLYEHVHAGQSHDHLVCRGCGRVVEFVSPGIAALQAGICRAHGFSPDHHQLQILGLCNACAQATR